VDHGDILIDDGVILSVAPAIEVEDAEVVDATGVMPGPATPTGTCGEGRCAR
jgi:dihydroorotase-like cyclic amidohydrolase